MPVYPAPPWEMHGTMWLTFFHLGLGGTEHHPSGLYGAALVEYVEPSPLTYAELLVARLARRPAGGRAVTITDIWVDSPASRAGGRELWAIPKGLADLHLARTRRGRLERASWQVTRAGDSLAEADVTAVPRLGPPLPFRAPVEQPGIDDHPEPAVLAMAGRARVTPARARWRFAPDGPLAYLRDARQLASVRLDRFAIRFG